MKNILIITSGKLSKLDGFKDKGLTLCSFNDIWFSTENEGLMIGEKDLKEFDLIYFRMVGKSLEIATLVADYAIKNGITIVDRIYQNSRLMPISLGKGIELKKLIEANIPMPKTVFGNLEKLDFPFVVKSTSSSRAREVWLVKTPEELEKLKKEKFKKGKFYFAQEFISDAKRARVLVVGDKVVGGILRQTKWNKDQTKITLNPVPKDMQDISLQAVKASGLDICGVDILVDGNNRLYIIEVNAAPTWKLINKYCGVSVEDEIIKYIQGKI